MAINQEAFEKGGAIPLRGGGIAYIYAPYGSVGGLIEGFVVGQDKDHNWQFTNVRTVTIGPDCNSVQTSFPGTPRNISPNDQRIVGSPRWWNAINTHF